MSEEVVNIYPNEAARLTVAGRLAEVWAAHAAEWAASPPSPSP